MALKYVHLQILDKEKIWADMLYLVASGDASQYQILKRMNVIEFFHLVDNFKRANEPRTKK